MGKKDNPSDVLIAINFYDGALNRITEKNQANITSYNTSVFLAASVAMRVTVKLVRGKYIGKLPLPILRPNIPRINRV